MSEDLRNRLRELTIHTEGAEERAVEAIASRGLAPKAARISQALVAACLAVLLVGVFSLTPPGRSVAEAAGHLVGIGDPVQASSPTTPQEADDIATRIDLLWQGVIDKAEAGELNTNVDPADVIRVMRYALAPSHDPATASQQQDEVIEMTAKLRAGGDLPPLGEGLLPPLPQGGAGN